MASTDARPIPLKNTAFRVTAPILDADGDLVTAAASLDSEVSIDGGTFADVTAEATEIATSSGIYFLDLTAAEMNGDTIAVIIKTGTAGAKTTPIVMYPEETGDINVDVTAWLGTAAATPTVAGVPEVDITHLLGTAWLAPGTAGTPDVNVKLWNALTTVALPLIPTVAGRTLDVSVGGEAGVDWANVGSPTSTVGLTNTTVGIVTLANTTTTLTNLPAITANWLTAAGTAADFGAELATAIWTDTTAGDFTVALSIGKSVMNGVALGTGLTINAYTGNTVQTGDSFARLGAPAGASVSADILVIDNFVDGLEATIGAAGAGLSAIPWNAAWDAESQSEVEDALAAYHVVMVKTTIATLASQTSFTLTAGSADNDAYNGCEIVIEDSATAAQKAVGVVDDYTGATKTVTLRTDPAVFTMATSDVVTIRPSRSLKSTVDNRTLDVTATGAGGVDWGNVENKTTTNDLTGTNIATSQVVASVSGAVGSVTGNVGGNVVGSVGSISGITFPSNFAALGINASGHVSRVVLVDTLTAYTGNTVQTGDSFARIGAAGAGLTDLGGMSTTMKAQVEQEALDALQQTVPDSIPADGTRPSIQAALYMICQGLFEGSISGTTWTIKKVDGSTTLFTETLDSATTPTSKTRAT